MRIKKAKLQLFHTFASMKRKIINILPFLMAFLMTRCANQVAPTGGPKDTSPPKVVQAVPENRSVGFNERRIEITFDEYVTLNNASQQVLFSPPLTNKPDIKLGNKTVVIKLKEELRPNTTYTIQFGEAVKDLHEGNIFKDYAYSFATGETLDTLTLAGKVIDAATQKPVDKLFVELYTTDNLNRDSLFLQPTLRAPDFIARTDKEGQFRFYGLPDKAFLVFALEDMNANLYYDMPNEKVAFLDTLVRPSDSVSLSLEAFTETDTNQMLLENKLVEEGLLRFVFRQPADSVALHLNWPAVDSFQVVEAWSARHDTLCCWFTPNVIDSVEAIIQYDTFFNIRSNYNLKIREARKQTRNQDKTLKISDNLKNKMLMPGEDLLLRFSEPVTYINNKVYFEQFDDYGMVYRLTEPVSDTSEFTLELPDSAFCSIRGRYSASLNLRFKRAKNTDVGNIFITVVPPVGMQAVIQLLDGRGKVLDERVIDSASKVGFTQLVPKKYKLQAILDADRNGRWSPGNFHKRFLPETIVIYKDELDLKAGWDIDLDEIWSLKGTR